MITQKELTHTRSGWHWLGVALLVFIIDRVTKNLAVYFLAPYVPIHIFPTFNLALGFNRGAAFSLLQDGSGWQIWLFTTISIIVSIGVVIWLKCISYQQRWLSIALTLVLGGALGNAWDRILNGQVIDFIQLHIGHYYWPTFNIADSAICVGAVMILLDAFIARRS